MPSPRRIRGRLVISSTLVHRGREIWHEVEPARPAAPLDAGRAEASPPDQGEDQEDERREEDGVAERGMGGESVGHRGLSDRAVIVGYVDGMKRAVSGK